MGIAANLLAAVGTVAVTVAAWWVHPAAGLAVAGLLCITLAVGLVRSCDDRNRAE